MGVLVTGMHRSGTSAIARWLDTLGVGGASSGDFPMDRANPRGLYELQDVVALNDRWLGVLGGSWWAPPVVKEQTWRSMAPDSVDADRATLPAFTGESSNWLLKDPRISLLLPLWDRLLLTRSPVVVGLRAPREVAMSLHVRNGTTFRRGLALWAFYNQQLLDHLHARRSIVIDFESALAEPAAMLDATARFLQDLGIPVPAARVDAALAELEPKLRRNVGSPLDGTAEALARDLDDVYESLRKRHLGSAPGGTAPLPDWAAEAIDELGEFWGVQVQRDIATTEGRIARQERDIARHERDIAHRERDIAAGQVQRLNERRLVTRARSGLRWIRGRSGPRDHHDAT